MKNNNTNLSNREAMKNALRVEREEVKALLGADFKKAILFYQDCHGKIGEHGLKLGDYFKAADMFRTLNGFVNSESLDYSADDVVKMFGEAYGLNADNLDDDQLSAFIDDCTQRYILDTQTEKITKEPLPVFKGTLMDTFEGSDGLLYIDLSKASEVTVETSVLSFDDNKEVNTLRKVLTSENGALREFAEIGRESGIDCVPLVLDVSAKSADLAQDTMLRNKKRNLFRNGLIDISTGVHYQFGMRGASQNRKGHACFLVMKDWNDTFKFWFRVTGLNTAENFTKAFGEYLNFSKTLTRCSSRASASFNLDKTRPEISAKIKAFKALYIGDKFPWAEMEVNRPYYTMVGPNHMVYVEDKTRSICINDGGMLISVECAAYISLALRLISNNSFNRGIALWNAHIAKGGTASTATGELLVFLQKLPVFQVRHGAMKGMANKSDHKLYGLTNVTYGDVCTVIPEGHTADEFIDLSEYDIICPASVRKFMDGEWADYPLEICGYLKEGNGMVNLNPQFINALQYEDPTALLPIVDDIIDRANESVNDPAKALAFHKIYGNGDSELVSMLGDVLRTNADLINEIQVQEWRKKQYEKLFKNLRLGRIPVPGQYSYMVSDPYGFLAHIFKIDIHHLQAGEQYYNGLDCKAGWFRSPMIHPFEAQKVQLVSDPAYYWYKNVALFNIYDQLADRMGGGDFDGDRCAVIPEDTWQGKIVVDGIADLPYDEWEASAGTDKQYFVPNADDEKAMNNLIEYLVDSSCTDRTGIITNYGTSALSLSNHLKGIAFMARKNGADTIAFVHPKQFGEEQRFGADFIPGMRSDGKYYARGFVMASYDKQSNSIKWNDESEYKVVGYKTIDEVLKIANDYQFLTLIVHRWQGREIDGAKNGVYAEGPRYDKTTGKGNEYVGDAMVKFVPKELVFSQFTKKRIKSLDAKIENTYFSISPWGCVFQQIEKRSKETNFALNLLSDNGIIKTPYLISLLTEEERNLLNKKFSFKVGTEIVQMTFVEALRSHRSDYVNKMKAMKIMADKLNADIDNEDNADDSIGLSTFSAIKSQKYEEIEKLSTALGIPMEVTAVGCYVANFAKTNSDKKNSFAWLCFGDLLSVFSRDNKKFRWFRVPQNATEASVKDGVLYVNGKKHSMVNAYDRETVLLSDINGRRYAWVHMVTENPVIPSFDGKLYEGKEYEYNLMGFTFYGFSSNIMEVLMGSTVRAIMIKEGPQSGRMLLYGRKNGEEVPFCSIANSKSAEMNMSLAELDGRMLKITCKGEIKEKSVVGAKFIVVG